MKCLILAAGYATRLYPLTENFPKPLLKVGEKSILDWLVDDLVDTTDIDEFVVISNHKFAQHFEDWKSNKQKTRPYEITVLDDGTSTNETRLGAVKDIQLAVENLNLADDLLVMAGDNVLDFSLSKFVDTVIADYHHPELDWVGDSRMIFITAHRRENLGQPMHNMFRAIRRVLNEHPDVKAIYPIHMNPIVRKAADEELGDCKQIHIIDPIEVCINCGLCVKHCPANHTYKFVDNMVTYAAYRTEPDKQIGSSSGGVAAALYELAISKEWSIIGTVIDSDFRVKMQLSNDKQAIESFKGSKYVQAYTIEALTELKRTLKEDKNVLFIGTPCECEAARSVANGNEEKLLTVDLICHGVPSNKILNDYIKWIEKKKKTKIKQVSFRSSWGEEMILKDESKDVWHRRMFWDPYLEAFNAGITINSSCFTCPFACEKRCSDITIGDFWGIGSESPFHKPNRKVSVIGVNSKRGFDFLNECKSLVLEKRNWSEAVAGNSQLRAPLPKSSQYDLFWEKYYKYGIDAAFKATVYKKVCKRYYKEYPIILLKSIIKKCLCWDRKIR